MMNLTNESILLKRVRSVFLIGVAAILFGCTTTQLPPEIQAEINSVPVVTPAVPNIPAAATATEPEAPAPAAVENSEQSSYPEPAVAVADSAYPAANASAAADVSSAAVVEETNAVPVIDPANEEGHVNVDPAVVAPVAEQSSAEYLDLGWPDLIPADFSVDEIYQKYQEALAEFSPGDPKALEIQAQMMEEFNNAPTNDELNGKFVRVPGFITPLDYSADTVTEFLLVPYFGACIHVPPPPVNQTVYVTTGADDGIALEDTFSPIWVVGILQTESQSTELATAGYTISNAAIELYSDQQ